MIPKKIHYCWFGRSPKPKLAEKCIQSWRKYCHDYEIIEWNEDNYDLNSAPLYVQQAYEARKWAFVTDYARLQILYEHGGVYFDTDVEILKGIDDLLNHKCFMGIENSTRCIKVATGLGIGSVKGFPLIAEMMEDYLRISFMKEDGTYDTTTCTNRNTEVLKHHGYREENVMQNIAGAVIYPTEYFSPMVMENAKKRITKNTYTIHHYSLSWTPRENQIRRKKNLRKYRINEFFYNIRVLPNNVLMKCLGQDQYNQMKQRLKK